MIRSFVSRHHRAFLFCLVLGAGCGKAKPPPEAPATPVRARAIARTDMAEVLVYAADLKAYAEVEVFSPVPDRILYFAREDGDEVARGDRIALIRKDGLDKGLEQLVAQAEALDAQIANLARELERNKELLAAEAIPQQAYDQTKTQHLSLIAQRKALEASRAQLAITAGNANVTAPISGVIAGKMLQKGDMAVPQIPLCRILQIDKLKARLALIEADVAKVKLGQAATLELDAYPGQKFPGTVTTIMPFLDPGTRTNTVEVTLENPKDQATGRFLFKPGMFGRVRLVVADKPGVISAPEAALLLDNYLLEEQRKDASELRRAFVVEDGVAKERRVRLGFRQGSLWEVQEGLAEGELIVVRGHHALKDGQRVKIEEEAKP